MKLDFTVEECIATISWAMARDAGIPYRRGAWNAMDFLFKEHCFGLASAGGTIYKCAVGFNIDYDLRCGCCGAILALGSVDIEGPRHEAEPDVDLEADTGGEDLICVARSAKELAEALGTTGPVPKAPEAAARAIFKTFQRARPCSCLDQVARCDSPATQTCEP